jgi:hypothetical protein
LLYPAFFLLVIIECADKRLKGNKLFPKTVIIFLLSVIVIWAGYGFSMKSFLAQAGNHEKKIDFTQKTLNRFIPGWDRQKTEHLLKDIKFPLTTYITGIFGVAEHTKEGHNSFFLGKWSQYGNRWYYIVAFLVKTPLPILAMLCLSLLSLYRKPLEKNELYMAIPAVLILAAASLSKLQIGLRYILPIYPLSCIFISRLATFKAGIVNRLATLLFGSWLVIVTLLTWPNYLSYFNEFIGGPKNGWKYLRDSNIDWARIYQRFPCILDKII